MKKTVMRLGTAFYWLAWPAYLVYFRLSERTRVLLVAGDEALLLKGWTGNGKWNLAGGGLHKREDPRAGALREVLEETGIRLEPEQLEYLGKEMYRDKGISFTYHVFVGTVDRSQQLTRQRHEIADIQWMAVADLTSRTASQEVLACVRAARSKGLLQ